MAIVLFLLCFAQWMRFIKKNKIEYKYFKCTIIGTIVYWSIIGLIILFESRIDALTFGILSILFYFASFILCWKRMFFFLDTMQKYYPIVMQEPVGLILWLHIHFLVYKLRVLYYSLKRKWVFVKTVSSVLMLVLIHILKFL